MVGRTEMTGNATWSDGHRDGIATATAALGVLMGVGLVAAGIVGWIADATGNDGSDLVFWLLFLVGGGALVLAGVGLMRSRPWAAVAAFAVGGVAGSLALFWSVIAPVLALALVVLGVIHARRSSS